jgi:hypothetical protein
MEGGVTEYMFIDATPMAVCYNLKKDIKFLKVWQKKQNIYRLVLWLQATYAV